MLPGIARFGTAPREQVDELAPARRLPVGPVGGLGQYGGDHVVETHDQDLTAAARPRKRLLARASNRDGPGPVS
jgi:hypothetical protein